MVVFSKFATVGTPSKGVFNLRYPRTRYKSTWWRRNAWAHLRRMSRIHGGNFGRNYLANVRGISYKVGWTAPTAVGLAHAAQKRWRKKYFNTYGEVV